MKLALRFLVAAILPVALIIVGNGWLRVKREVRLLTEEVAVHQRAMGRALAAGVAQSWPTGGEDAARALIRASSDGDDLIQLGWISRAAGALDALPADVRGALEAGRVSARGKPGRGGDDRLRSHVPVTVDGELKGAIVLTERLDREDEYLVDTVVRVGANTLIAVLAVSLIMTLMGWLLVARRVDALVRLVRRIGDEGEALEIVGAGSDELGALADEVMATHARLVEARARAAEETERRLRAVEQLRHADRLATVGQLASGMAHELGTPLNVALGRARMLQDGVSDEKRPVYLEVIVRQIERMTAIVRQVLDFSRRATPAKKPTALLAEAQSAVQLLLPAARKKDVTVEVTGEEVTAEVDPVQLGQVISNLVLNAVHACASGDRVTVETGTRTEDGTGALRAFVRVSDTGPGMAEHVKDRVFDPFFTTKDVGEGTGLGLSVAHGIALDHGGRIEVESAPGEGARFTVILPLEES